jgi:multidrug resistance efflux pump
MERCGAMRIKAILMLLVIMISVAGCKAEDPQTTVEEIDLSQEKKSIEAFGVVKPEEFMDIIIDFNSVVKEVSVNEGQYLKLNEPILLLDLSQYEADISDTVSELNIAELEYQQISMGFEDLSAEVNKLKNNIKYTEGLHQNTIKELDINKKLFEEGVISEEKYNQSKLKAEEAENNLENLKFELSNAEDAIYKKTQSEKAKYAVQSEYIAQIKNRLNILQNKLNKPYIAGNQIVSMYDNAVVYDIQYQPGHITDVSKKAFSIANLDSLTIEAEVVEEFIKDVREGLKVKIVPAADRTIECEGRVIYVSDIAYSKNGGTVVPIKISLDNNDSFLKPNYNVDVYIEVQ